MDDQSVLQRFVKKRPLAVMTRLIVGEVLDDDLEAVFDQHRGRNYTRDMLFSNLCLALADVVLEFSPSPHQAYIEHKEALAVSKNAFYNKLKNVSLPLSRALVQHSYRKCRRMLEQMNVPTWTYLPGYRTKIIDGNSISAGENRLKELRATWQKALPAKSVVVLDADRQLIQDIFLLEDGQAQERTVLEDILQTLEAKDLIFADSAYCTIKFLCGIHGIGACFIVRQHGTLQGELLGKRKSCGPSDTGKLFEQAIRIGGSDGITIRRITLELFEPTVDGDLVIHLLSNVPVQDADAEGIASLYRQRWEIEHKFYVAQVALRCEVDALNYPKSNLFVFCLAMLALNCRQVMFGAMYQAFEEEIEEEASHYSVSVEITNSYDGLLTAIDEELWQTLIPKTFAGRMSWLIKIAGNYNRSRHQKAVRGPKKKPPSKSKYRNGHHLSVKKILDARKANQPC
jgi:hypothetical protein